MSQRRLTALVAFVVAGISASCASTENYQYPNVESYGSAVALLHFVRKKSPWMSAVSAPIEVNGKLIGEIGPGGQISAKVPASRTSISTNGSSIEIEVHKGLDYFFEVSAPLQDPLSYPIRFEVSAVSSQRASALGLAVP